MANLTDNDFKSKFDLVFPNNSGYEISPEDMRTFVEDIKDSFANNLDYGETGALELDTGSTYNINFQGKRVGAQHFQISADITLSNAVNPVTNAMFLLSLENTSGGTVTVNISNNSRYVQAGDVTGSVDIDTGITSAFLGRVDSSGIIHWILFGGGSGSGGSITVANLTFNPAVAQTYTTAATHQSYTQTGVINLTIDLTGAVNGVEKIYQIVGNGDDFTFSTDCVNSDDGVTQPVTINYTGTYSIYTYYDASLGKIKVDTPLFDVSPESAVQIESWPGDNTISLDRSRHYSEHIVNTPITYLFDNVGAINNTTFVDKVDIQAGGSIAFSSAFASNEDGESSVAPITNSIGKYKIYGLYDADDSKVLISIPKSYNTANIIPVPTELLTISDIAPTVSITPPQLLLTPSVETFSIIDLSPTIDIGFGPDSISDNLFLLDAEGGTDIVLNPGVRIDWNDKNTNSHDFSSTTSSEFPVYSSDALVFDGGDHLETGIDTASPFGTFDMHKGLGATIAIKLNIPAAAENDGFGYILGNRHFTAGVRGFVLWLDDRSSQSLSRAFRFHLSNGSTGILDAIVDQAFVIDTDTYFIIRVEDGHVGGNDLSILQDGGTALDEVIGINASSAFTTNSEVNRDLWLGDAEGSTGNNAIFNIKKMGYWKKWIETGSADMTKLVNWLT